MKEFKVIFLTDCSGSMSGTPIETVVNTIQKFKNEAKKYRDVKVHIDIIGFSDRAFYISNNRQDIIGSGCTNLGAGYRKLAQEVRKLKTPPIIVLLSDGLPTHSWQCELRGLKSLPMFQESTRYSIGYNISDSDAFRVLAAFSGKHRTVVNGSPDVLARILLKEMRILVPKHIEKINHNQLVINITDGKITNIKRRTYTTNKSVINKNGKYPKRKFVVCS